MDTTEQKQGEGSGPTIDQTIEANHFWSRTWAGAPKKRNSITITVELPEETEASGGAGKETITRSEERPAYLESKRVQALCREVATLPDPQFKDLAWQLEKAWGIALEFRASREQRPDLWSDRVQGGTVAALQEAQDAADELLSATEEMIEVGQRAIDVIDNPNLLAHHIAGMVLEDREELRLQLAERGFKLERVG